MEKQEALQHIPQETEVVSSEMREGGGPNFRVVDRHADKNFMVGFDGRTEEECFAYNAAIRAVLDEAGMRPFHQVGLASEPGYHAWEVWTDTTREQLEELLSKIEELAHKWFDNK